MAYVNFGGGRSPLVTLLIVIFIIAIAYFVFIRNPNWLKNLMGGKVGVASATHVDGPNVYTVKEAHSVSDNTSDANSGGSNDCDSATSVGSSWRDNVPFDCCICNRETTWILTPSDSGDWSVKLGSHGSNNDNGSLIEMGQICVDSGGGTWRCEGPHEPQNYQDVSGGSASAPALAGMGKIGIKGISWPTGENQIHHEIWIDTTGSGTSWDQIGTFDGSPEGCNATGCPVPSGTGGASCQDTLRFDNGTVPGWESRRFDEIIPNQRADGTATSYPAALTATCTPGAGSGGGGDGDGDGDTGDGDTGDGDGDGDTGDGDTGDGDGDTGDGDGATTPQCDDSTCTCPGGGTIPLIGSQTCANCTQLCGGSAAAARRRRSRRASLARRRLANMSVVSYYDVIGSGRARISI